MGRGAGTRQVESRYVRDYVSRRIVKSRSPFHVATQRATCDAETPQDPNIEFVPLPGLQGIHLADFPGRRLAVPGLGLGLKPRRSRG